MLRSSIPEKAYYRNYMRIREPFFCEETSDPVALENWILPCNNPWSAFFYVSALFDSGLPAEALQWIRMAWGGILKRGAVNCWEEWGTRSSLCHAWGSSPAYFMHREILGVKHEGAWQGVVSVRPDLLDLDWASGTVALDESEGSAIRIELSRTPGGTRVRIKAPDSVKVRLDLSRLPNPVLSPDSWHASVV